MVFVKFSILFEKGKLLTGTPGRNLVRAEFRRIASDGSIHILRVDFKEVAFQQLSEILIMKRLCRRSIQFAVHLAGIGQTPQNMVRMPCKILVDLHGAGIVAGWNVPEFEKRFAGSSVFLEYENVGNDLRSRTLAECGIGEPEGGEQCGPAAEIFPGGKADGIESGCRGEQDRQPSGAESVKSTGDEVVVEVVIRILPVVNAGFGVWHIADHQIEGTVQDIDLFQTADMESGLRIKHFEDSRGNGIDFHGQNVCFIDQLLRHQTDEVADSGAEFADFSTGKAALDGHGPHKFNQLPGSIMGREGARPRGAVFTVRKQIFEFEKFFDIGVAGFIEYRRDAAPSAVFQQNRTIGVAGGFSGFFQCFEGADRLEVAVDFTFLPMRKQFVVRSDPVVAPAGFLRAEYAYRRMERQFSSRFSPYRLRFRRDFHNLVIEIEQIKLKHVFHLPSFFC